MKATHPGSAGRRLLRGLAGGAAFLLPALVAFIGVRLDHSHYRRDPSLAAAIPAVAWTTLILAVTVPTLLLLTSRLPWPGRIAAILGVWCLLALELWMIFVMVMAHH